MTIMETVLRRSAETPVRRTRADRKRVKKVKLAIKPKIMPNGRDFEFSFVLTEEERIIGRTGKIQGERMVTIPAIKAKITKKTMSIILHESRSYC
jgi:hypothetical protein